MSKVKCFMVLSKRLFIDKDVMRHCTRNCPEHRKLKEMNIITGDTMLFVSVNVHYHL